MMQEETEWKKTSTPGERQTDAYETKPRMLASGLLWNVMQACLIDYEKKTVVEETQTACTRDLSIH